MSNDPSRPTRRPVRGPQGGQTTPDASSGIEPDEVVSPAVDATDSAFEHVEVVNHYEPEPTVAPRVEPAEPEVTVETASQPTQDVAPKTEAEPFVNPAAPFAVAPTPAPVEVTAPRPETLEDEQPMAPLTAPLSATKAKKFGRGTKPETSADAKPQKKRSYNPKRKSIIITGSVIGGIVLVLGFSIYKVGQAPSTTDIVAVYQEQSGDLGFPVDKGQDAATRYLSLYLDIPEDSSVRQQHKDLLGAMLINGTAPTAPSGVSQRIISGPTPAGLLIQTSPVEGNQRYTAIVETTVAEPQPATPSGDPVPDKVTKTMQQVTYRVNLQLDPTGETVLVVGNPTLIPNTELTSEMKQVPPPPAPDGPFGNELTDSLVAPFFKVWGASDTAAINSWLATGASGTWTKGLGGTVTAGSVAVSAPMGVKTTGEGDVTADVQWASANGAMQTSTYTLRVIYENERWLILNLS